MHFFKGMKIKAAYRMQNFKHGQFFSVPASVCGNGLVEGWEECDCGEDEAECSMDKCCFPANHPDNACQRKPNAVCRLLDTFLDKANI